MEFIIDSCVRGHHISEEFWTPELGEELSCQHEEGNPNDVYTVAVKTDANIQMAQEVASIFKCSTV